MPENFQSGPNLAELDLTERFNWTVRVYYEDTDAGGVVYHTSYLRFLERARSEWLRAHGVTQSTLAMEHALLFAVTQVHVDFVAPAKLDDVLQVGVSLVKRGGASLHFEQCIVRTHDAKELIRATVRAACLNAKTFLPERIPVKLLKK